jgi:hypothetical protein
MLQLLRKPCEEPPSLLPVCPLLHKYTRLVMGPYRAGPPLVRALCSRMALFWAFLCVLGFLLLGPTLGSCGGGLTVNFSLALLYTIPFVNFFVLRFALYITLHGLQPCVAHFVPRDEAATGTGSHALPTGWSRQQDGDDEWFVDPAGAPHWVAPAMPPLLRTMNTTRRYQRDKWFLTTVTGFFSCFFPFIVFLMALYSYTNLVGNGIAALPWNPPAPGDEWGGCGPRLGYGVFVNFFVIAAVSTILSEQLILLFLVGRLYAFRIKVLYTAMVYNDRALLARELSPDTPASDRVLLASAPELLPLAPQGAGYVGGSLAMLGAATACSTANDTALDNFILVYRAVREEASRHAFYWSLPIIVFIAGYSIVFSTMVWAVIQDMARGAAAAKGALGVRLEIMYGFLALFFLVLNLVPVITINGKWQALLTRVGHTWERWSPVERIALCAYFEQHPLVFPVMGLTFTWGKVAGLVGTAVVPLLVNAATNALKGAAPDPSAAQNATGR